MGKNLEAKIARMGSRFLILTIVGDKRPMYLVESAFLSFMIGDYVRNEIPIFPTCKQHEDTPAHFDGLVKKLHVSHVSSRHSK